MDAKKNLGLVVVFLAVGLLLFACATGSGAGTAQKQGDSWVGKIGKPDHLDGNFRFEANAGNPAVFSFVNTAMGRAETDAVVQTVLAALPELNAKPYSYEDLFTRFGPPTRITIFKADNGEHLNWYYGPVDFYVGPAGIRVREARVEEEVPGFDWMGLHCGDPVDAIAGTIGPVKETVDGKNEWGDRVLYRNFDGKKGNGYFANNQKGVRVFVYDDRICAIYILPGR
jgi:hypothetical protein